MKNNDKFRDLGRKVQEECIVKVLYKLVSKYQYEFF